MGIDLARINYMEPNEMVSWLQSEIQSQCDVFLADIPINSIEVSRMDRNNQAIIYIAASFNYNNTNVTRSILISSKDEVLDYVIAKFDE